MNFDVGLYAVDDARNRGKYLVIKQLGGGVSPTTGGLNKDQANDRTWIQVGVDIEYGFKSETPEVYLYANAPKNANNETQVSTTTGWSFTLGGSVSSDAIGAEASLTYTSEKTETINISDFNVKNRTDPRRGKWEYRLDGTENCSFDPFEHLIPDDGDHRFEIFSWCVNYGYFQLGYRIGKNVLEPLVIPPTKLEQMGKDMQRLLTPSRLLKWRRSNSWWADIKEIPTLGKLTLQPKSEVIWRADLDYNGSHELYYRVVHRIASLYRPGSDWGNSSTARCVHREIPLEGTFRVDFSKVGI